MLRAQVRLALPEWIHEVVEQADVCATDADKVAFAIELSRRNIHAQTGGPFGAAVFGPDDHLVAVGVNRVLPQSTSVAHAEIMAYLLAQQGLGRARLNERADGSHFGPYVLATSSQPCCQCYGATIWAGIDRLLIGARSQDVESLTDFDEGPLPQDWIGELEKRGVAVVQDLHRERACAVLSEYGAHGGKRY